MPKPAVSLVMCMSHSNPHSNIADCYDCRMLLIMLLMYTTAHKKIRQQCFEAFWYTHHLVSAARSVPRLKLITRS